MQERTPYKRGREPEMDIPEGKTCGDCFHFKRCNKIFGHIAEDESCDWAPSRFKKLDSEFEKQHEEAVKQSIDRFSRGVSSYCEAPLDVSQVITSGRYKNHGPRFCSKCGVLCFMV